MLINLMIENWKVFEDETSLSMVAASERRFKETLAKPDGFRSLKVLPAASIYGGNASGKTSLLEALSFIKDYVVNGRSVDEETGVDPFCLSADPSESPTAISVTFLANGQIYSLLVEFLRDRVLSEMLTKLKDRGAVDTLYARRGDYDYFFGPGFTGDENRARFVMDGTRPNQLFLTSAATQQIECLDAPFRWFKDSLNLVGVGDELSGRASYFARPDFLAFASSMLSSLDTGIVKIDGEEVSIESIPNSAQLLRRIPDNDVDLVIVGNSPVIHDYSFDMTVIEIRNRIPSAKRIRSYHESRNGGLVPFELSSEASGTQRLLALMPMLYDLTETNPSRERVYVVDELDRCFHTMLTKRIVELFLESCNAQSRKQLIFTTHDLFLMDQGLMRRDEMYITDRTNGGSAELIGLNEFQGIRYDKDLIRSYLDGRFGGIPMFGAGAAFHG